jgi:hypothetical protein
MNRTKASPNTLFIFKVSSPWASVSGLGWLPSSARLQLSSRDLVESVDTIFSRLDTNRYIFFAA